MNYQDKHSPSVEQFRGRLIDRLTSDIGVLPADASLSHWLRATAMVVREELMRRWHATEARVREARMKQVAYLSMEYLMSRPLANALAATGLEEETRKALNAFDVDLDSLLEHEREPALGNGGLGRLAACYLDSMATMGIPAIGYGLRYDWGMFRQEIHDGWQIERPDRWQDTQVPWEVVRFERSRRIRFGGRVEHRNFRAHWVEGEECVAVPYDTLVPGHGRRIANTLRLWQPRAVEPIDLGAFNRGAHGDALSPSVSAQTISSFLYPDDSTPHGRELRLRQEYFFVAASIQDAVARFREYGEDWDRLPDLLAVHLNDTHPALAPAELMRIMVDEHGLEWDDAWEITGRVFTFTNHTLMPEALEMWPVETLYRIIPRHLEIVEEIDRRFLAKVAAESTVDPQGLRVVEDGDERQVNMGRLSVLASHHVNGVSKLHSVLLVSSVFADYARIYPDRFDNVTNGITPRLWLMHCNPGLADLLDEAIGDAWRSNLPAVEALKPFAGDPAFQERFRKVKHASKAKLAGVIAERTGIRVDPSSMFDVQIKRIHEYKRQLLNILGLIVRWNAIRAKPELHWTPRTVILSGKAASAYQTAKLIIKFAHDVAARINADPVTSPYLRLVFLPNYNVPLAESIIPAANLSQQISLAGTEASGTGNMKLALNGALTLGTWDGANIEIAEAVGEGNVFTFGMLVEEVLERRLKGYIPYQDYLQHEDIRRAVDLVIMGEFSPDDHARFRPLMDTLLRQGDAYMVLADLPSYLRAQRDVDQAWTDKSAWTRRAILNVAGMGYFSSDRAIAEYAERAWNAPRLKRR